MPTIGTRSIAKSFQPLGGLGRPPGSKNVSFGDSQDALYGHQRISGRRDFADFEAYRGGWWCLWAFWRAVGGGNQGLLVESAFLDFQVQKCDSEKVGFVVQGRGFGGFWSISRVVVSFDG